MHAAAQEQGKPSQEQQQQEPPPKPPEEAEPPEEDENLSTPTYAFNPVQAEKEVKIGNFYFKKGNFKAALARFEEAVKWNSGLAEAWFRMGEARERLEDQKGALEAYRRVLDLEPGGKRAKDAKEKLAKM
jgi:tetratricopeptide (TPR) repeat protein